MWVGTRRPREPRAPRSRVAGCAIWILALLVILLLLSLLFGGFQKGQKVGSGLVRPLVAPRAAAEQVVHR
jgi:hypothetical protein